MSRIDEIEHVSTTLLTSASAPLWVVGGYVRDLLSGVSSTDLDIILEGPVEELARKFQGRFGGEVTEYKNFGTAKVQGIPGLSAFTEIDFARARTEVYPFPGSLPQVTFADLKSDLSRRDFTINSISLPLAYLPYVEQARSGVSVQNYLYDPFCGLSDLEGKEIRILHAQSFVDDPTRVFRAVRYAGRLGFALESRTAEHLKRSICEKDALQTISLFRIFNEFKKICLERRARYIFELMYELDIFSEIKLPPTLTDAESSSLFSDECVQRILQTTPTYGELIQHVVTTLSESVREDFFKALQIPKKQWGHFGSR